MAPRPPRPRRWFRPRQAIYAAPSARHGLGVFAAQRLAKGAVVEECPVLVVSDRHYRAIDRTELRGYLYEWDGRGDLAFALGFGSLYNHSSEPNASYEMRVAERRILIRASRDIPAGDEITIDYGHDPVDGDALWFDPSE